MPSKYKKLVWYAPKWSISQKRWWVLRKYLLSPGPLVRITVASLIATLLVLGSIKFMLPGFVTPNIWPVMFALPAVLGAMVLQTGLLSLFRQRVLVTTKKIVISHGQSATVIPMKSLKHATLTAHNNGKSRIRFDFLLGRKRRFRTVGLSDDCDLFRLAELLPIEITTRDARRSTTIRETA